MDVDVDREDVRLSITPDHISLDEESRRSSPSESSFESEEGVDEEVLSEYKPTKTKPKVRVKVKVQVQGHTQNQNQNQSQDQKGETMNMLKGKKRNKRQVPIHPIEDGKAGPIVPGYTLIIEGGIAYTDDAELKQTREVCPSSLVSSLLHQSLLSYFLNPSSLGYLPTPSISFATAIYCHLQS